MSILFNTLVALVPLRQKPTILFIQTQYIDLKKRVRIAWGVLL